jgi:TRAP-type transport system periplasmic protein
MLEIVKLRLAAGLFAVALAASACGGTETQRAGGEPVGDTRVLTLANANGNTEELQLFIDQVDKLSDGRLRIKSSDGWRRGEKHYEQGLFEDVKAGKADLGWVGSRVLANLGVKDFEPLHAPFLVDSYEIQDQAVSGELGKRMLAALEPAGVTGVAILPGPMRFLQLDRAIEGPDGLNGLKIALQDSPLEEAAMEALGAEPVEIPSGGDLGALNGVEGHIGSIQGNHYYESAKYTVADAPLWPRPFVVFADNEAWDALPEADRRLIQEAAEAARAPMLLEAMKVEESSMAQICKRGGNVTMLGESGRARMQKAVAPLLEGLRNDPAAGEAMAEIDALRAGGSPHALKCPAGSAPTQRAALSGTFTATIRRSEPNSDTIAGDWDDSGLQAIKFDLELLDGRALLREHYPEGKIVGFDEGYSIFKDVIEFGSEEAGLSFTARWKLDGKRLRFTDVGGGPDDRFVWGRTWVKTG